MSNKFALQNFPCEFTIKVVGKNPGKFKPNLVAALSMQFPTIFLPEKLSTKLSSSQHFISLTLVVAVDSQEQLDTVYRFLTSFEDVMFTL